MTDLVYMEKSKIDKDLRYILNYYKALHVSFYEVASNGSATIRFNRDLLILYFIRNGKCATAFGDKYVYFDRLIDAISIVR